METQLLKLIGRLLPPWPHATGVINRILKPLYLRKPRQTVIARVFNFKMRLDPAQCVDGGLLFYPHLYERREVQFIRKLLKPGQVFVDVGSNIGFFSLLAASLVGPTGRVLAIEADPDNADRLRENLELNNARCIRLIDKGVSDRSEILTLYRNTQGNKGGHTFLPNLHAAAETVEVHCHSLNDIFEAEKLCRVDFLKIDIEGYEHKALSHFYANAPKGLFPTHIMIEKPRISVDGRNPISLLEQYGYLPVVETSDNLILKLEC